MKASLTALLANVIDYAGMFPPASLPLEDSLRNYREYRSGPNAWMLGRFICPADRLDTVANLAWVERTGSVSVLVPAAGDEREKWEAGLLQIRAFPSPAMIDTVELRWFLNTAHAARQVRELAERFAPLTLYFEFPRAQRPGESSWQAQLRNCVSILAEFNTASPYGQAGFKFRTGGATVSAIPTSAELAVVLCACRDYSVFWKATAGLHHPIRHDAGHGFVNLLTAAALADAQKLSPKEVQAILDDRDAAHFRFSDQELSWQDRSLSKEDVSRARLLGLRSFGSCSFTEPLEDLQSLGWLTP